ncbi:biopolymer transporter ExbD [uncultured Cohaesibacter sp.]|uniref:ExbD/TolR family protein n=1 Tax=uncultured Cohaesibacter sp. TaxID=1002546 RepID=UPI0029C66385|nr:biopolymer transporter ExbD [uncultured Cohaesibacter sp.]
MRMHKAKAHKKILPDNTIPLINIVFLMLIFFLIAGTVAPPVTPELTPPSARTLPDVPPAGNAIEILADGTLVHRGERLALHDILARFPAPMPSETSEDAPVGAPDDTLQILADKDLQASVLMPILQAFRAAGHKKIRLITLQERD